MVETHRGDLAAGGEGPAQFGRLGECGLGERTPKGAFHMVIMAKSLEDFATKMRTWRRHASGQGKTLWLCKSVQPCWVGDQNALAR